MRVLRTLPGEFSLRRETGFDRFAQRLGLAREIQTGDVEFDRACYVRTEHLDLISALFEERERRSAAQQLLQQGFNEVAVRDGKFQAIWTGFDPARDDAEGFIEQVIDQLGTLSHDAERFTERDYPTPTNSWSLYSRGLQWLCVALAPLVLAVLNWRPLHGSDLIFTSLIFSVPSWLVFLSLSVLLIRGHSRSHDAFLRILCFSLLGFGLGGAGATALINGLLDDSPATTHVEVIVRKHVHRSSRSTKHTVYYRSWMNPTETESWAISSSDYDRVILNRSQVEVVTHEGHLGVVWVESQRLLITPPPEKKKK